MIKTPCEVIIWKFLPALRRELIKQLVESGMSRKEVAKMFGLTEAAISHYLKAKRGRFKLDKNTRKSLQKISVEIAKGNEQQLVQAICSLCLQARKSGVICKLHHKENPCLKNCKLYKKLRRWK